ncbi:hypothetical protein EGH24_11695 [Halonotius terrestris]|uniref:RNA ligase domain-containing protein n=1 Tax=Halonotius terrestris TaxID=2487750 RepID=A0A8J8TBR4_9EURY|nr:hypothetical protein [Halonotius terrestris]TQQ79287.1 hypothetical protein EGH24_11695 [Halonotius terrestris]
MKQFPTTPSVADAPDDLLSGHLWILELIDGRPLRFQLQDSGLLRVGDAGTVYDDPDAAPLPLQRAVRHIRESLDRETLRAAVDDVEQVTFFGVATTRESTPYELDLMPSFLGTEVWSADSQAFRPPGAADGIFGRLGLDPINTFEREYHARDFAVDSYEIPQSAWYDGPAAGVVIRNKQGQRGKLTNDAVETSDDEQPSDRTADKLTETHATADEVKSVTTTLESAGQPVTVDAVTDRLLETIGRKHPTQVTGSGSVDTDTLRSAIASRVQQLLEQ